MTCKKRHVKCDEARPHCGNCLRTRGHCEGYAAESTKKIGGPGQLCWDPRESAGKITSMIPRSPNPYPTDLQDTTGILYFEEFVGLVRGPWITAASNGDLWGVTMPQLAHNNATLRRASMAIGALSMWHRQSRRESLCNVSAPATLTAEADTHYFRAVDYYCHALKLQSQQASVRDTVFLSVLLLFFESLRGNRRASLDHVNHGLALLLDLLADGDSSLHVANLAPDPKPVLGALADVFLHLGTQARAILPGRIGHRPPLPNLTKGLRNRQQTVESFMVFLSKLPRSTVTLDQIPVAFDTLDEFEEYWVVARRGQAAMTALVLEIIRSSWTLGPVDEETINKMCLDILSHPRVNKFCDEARESMQALDAAFRPLFDRIIMSEPDSAEYLRGVHLRLQYLGSYVFADPPMFFEVEGVVARTPLFREYLSLVEIALRTVRRVTTNPAQQLSLQSELSSYLLMVSLFCRDPMTREEAMWMLRDYPGQDGLWNTRSLYILALKNRTVERVNASEGTAEEQWRRLWRREFVFEDGGERIVFRHMDIDKTTGKWEVVEEVAEVRGAPEDVQWKRQPLTGTGGMLITHLYAN